MTKDHSQPVAQSDNSKSIAAAFGQQLSVAREKAGLSVAAIAKELCITSSAIGLLESGQWDDAGPDVYVRGYIIAYCRLLDMDVAEASLYFKLRKSKRVASDSLEAQNRQRRPEFAQYRRVFAYGAATLLIGPALIFWVAQGFRGGDPQTGTEQHEQLTASLVPVTQGQQQEQQSTVSQVGSEMPVMASMATVPETVSRPNVSLSTGVLPSLATESVAAPEPGSFPETGLLELDFQEDAWLEVSDNSGKRLEYGLMPADSERSFPIVQGLSVRLGNADSVVARVDGDVLDLRPYIDQDVADFDLPLVRRGEQLNESSVD